MPAAAVRLVVRAGPGPLFMLVLALAALSFAAHAATAAREQHEHERFQAIETGGAAVMILSPRWYPSPLSPARPPLFVVDTSLRKRQNVCEAGHHPCNELGEVGSSACCADNQYCIVDPGDPSKPSCCAIGSTCGSQCSESQYQCNGTSTITSSPSVTTSVFAACCGRKCPLTSMFGCPESFGGGCCSYGSTCGPSGQCLSSVMSSSSVSAVLTLVPDGCTTSQVSCASSLGGGCCAVTQSCVRLDDDSGPKCAERTVTPSASGIVAIDNPRKSELSAGAKAGISVGVIVIAGLVIGAVTWLCLRKRRIRRMSEVGGGPGGSGSNRPPRPTGVTGQVIGGGGGGGISGGGRRDMSDLNSERGGPLPGVVQDYFGPEPQLGPYSDEGPSHEQQQYGQHGGPQQSVVTPPAGGDPEVVGGVPLLPHGPGDITAPVEIDGSRIHARPQGEAQPQHPVAGMSGSAAGFRPPQSHVSVDGRFELYGSDPSEDLVTSYVPSPDTTAQSPPLEEGPGPSPGVSPSVGGGQRQGGRYLIGGNICV
ncbi:hypothetical protein B0H66DRAFT_115361 [Apodospora peruviana]|uniref:Uncharacterized protein n=1 Tax=Apodospora peruviana TaxID=516989 RepID=A0AAE0IJ02_9PEZI|nr:hypothetical protein B0H66DRAFT_115361 [Apodospora peruviana]